MSEITILAAGTIVRYSTDLQTPSWTVVPEVTAIGELGESAEPKQRTKLSDKRQVYGVGLQDSPDRVIKGQWLSSNVAQAAFLAVCKAKTPILLQIELPDGGTSGTIFEYLFQPFGVVIDEPNPEEWLMFTVNGKQNSEPTETPAVA